MLWLLLPIYFPLPKIWQWNTSVIIFIADLFSLFRCHCHLFWGSALPPYICLVRLAFIGNVSMLASGLVYGSLLYVFRKLGGRAVYSDDYSYLGSPYYSCWSQAKPVLLLRSIMLSGTEITLSINNLKHYPLRSINIQNVLGCEQASQLLIQSMFMQFGCHINIMC